MDKQGLLLCSQYSIAPNFLGYCGPLKANSLIDHLKEKIIDDEVIDILSDFETLYPYLQLIARKNHLNNPFDVRVVEAYWLGNSLLKPVSSLEYEAFTKEKLFLDKKITKKDFSQIMSKIDNYQFLPHHAFHVFNIFKRTGNDSSFQTLKTMDECRISWGKIVAIKNEGSLTKSLIVKTKPLIISLDSKESFENNNKRLTLGPLGNKKITVGYQGKFFLKDFQVGDWVSFHWGFVCDILTSQQVKNLEFYTQKAIDFYNQ